MGVVLTRFAYFSGFGYLRAEKYVFIELWVKVSDFSPDHTQHHCAHLSSLHYIAAGCLRFVSTTSKMARKSVNEGLLSLLVYASNMS